MEAEDLASKLRQQRLTVLAVSRHRNDPDVLVVYLHGNAGEWVDGVARRSVARIPGVLKVVESIATPSILLVQVEPVKDGDRIDER